MYKYRKLLLVILLVWMVMIFALSQQGHESSTGQSTAVITTVQDSVGLELTQFIVRKSAHIIAYFTLGIWVLLTAVSYRLRLRSAAITSLAIVVAYAMSDEIHQLFVAGRSGQCSDVLLDSVAGLIGIALTALIIRRGIYKNNKIV